MGLLTTFKTVLDREACRGGLEPAEITTRDFIDGDRVRLARAWRRRDGGYDVSVYEAKKGWLAQHFKKTETLRSDAGLVRAVIILDDWQKAQRERGAREDMTPSFGGGALVDNVARAKGYGLYLQGV